MRVLVRARARVRRASGDLTSARTRAHSHTAMPKKRERTVDMSWLQPGVAVEVIMEEPGLIGSRYPAKVLQVTAGKAKVEIPKDADKKVSPKKGNALTPKQMPKARGTVAAYRTNENFVNKHLTVLGVYDRI